MQCDKFGNQSPARNWGKALCQDRPGAHVMNSECFLTRSCVPRRKPFSTVVGKQGTCYASVSQRFWRSSCARAAMRAVSKLPVTTPGSIVTLTAKVTGTRKP